MMKTANITALVGSLVAAGGAYMPLGTTANQAYFVSITHMNGLPNTLYILPVAALVVAVIALYQKFSTAHWWYLSIAALGLLITYVSVNGAIEQVGAFARDYRGGQIGWGGIALFVGFFAIGTSGVSYFATGKKKASRERVSPY